MISMILLLCQVMLYGSARPHTAQLLLHIFETITLRAEVMLYSILRVYFGVQEAKAKEVQQQQQQQHQASQSLPLSGNQQPDTFSQSPASSVAPAKDTQTAKTSSTSLTPKAPGDLRIAPQAAELESRLAAVLHQAEVAVKELMTNPSLKQSRRQLEKRITVLVSQISGTQTQVCCSHVRSDTK